MAGFTGAQIYGLVAGGFGKNPDRLTPTEQAEEDIRRAPFIAEHNRRRLIALTMGVGTHDVEGIRFWVSEKDFGMGPILVAGSL